MNEYIKCFLNGSQTVIKETFSGFKEKNLLVRPSPIFEMEDPQNITEKDSF